MSYAEKLKDPRWQKTRLQVFDRDNWECLRCDCSEKTLHAHHLEYETGKDPWEYDLEKIVTLCEDCHEKAHDNNISEQVFKEIRPLTSNEHSENLTEFEKFYEELCDKKNMPINGEHFLRCIRAYFIDSDINFTTLKNTIKRVDIGFLPYVLLASRISDNYDEINKILLYSQKFTDRSMYRYLSIEKLVAHTIRKISLHKDYLIFKPYFFNNYDRWIECFNNIFFEFIFEILKSNDVHFNRIDFKYLDISIGQFLHTLRSSRTKSEESNKNFDPFYFMWDQDKWIEQFDCIDYTPPELKP